MTTPGEFAELFKDYVAAKKSYTEAASLAKAMGFDDGVRNSAEALARLAKKS